jgi:hypothetical protein
VDSEILRAESGGEYSDMSSDVAVALGVPKRAGNFGFTSPRAPDVARCRAAVTVPQSGRSWTGSTGASRSGLWEVLEPVRAAATTPRQRTAPRPTAASYPKMLRWLPTSHQAPSP